MTQHDTPDALAYAVTRSWRARTGQGITANVRFSIGANGIVNFRAWALLRTGDTWACNLPARLVPGGIHGIGDYQAAVALLDTMMDDAVTAWAKEDTRDV